MTQKRKRYIYLIEV